MRSRPLIISFLLLLSGAAFTMAQEVSAPPPAPAEGFVNDFSTVSRADYVFGCMAVNGETRDALERCSCSIDIIASLITFEEYESGETVLMVGQRGGENTAMFKTSPLMQAKVDKVRRAQTEAELRCF